MTLQEFITKYSGQPNVGDTPENTGQCVGLVEVYMDALGLNSPHEYGNAKDLLADANLNDFDVIANTPSDFPLSGDIVVWDGTWGNGDGHTGIAVSADAHSFEAFEQNDPVGSTPHTKQYDYTGVLGWLHPKVTSPPPNNDLAECLRQHDHLVIQCNQLQSLVTSLTQQTNDLNGKLSAAQTTIDQLRPLADQVPSLQQQAIDATKLRIQAEADKTLAQTARDQAVKALATAQANDYTRQQPSTLFTEWINALLSRRR